MDLRKKFHDSIKKFTDNFKDDRESEVKSRDPLLGVIEQITPIIEEANGEFPVFELKYPVEKPATALIIVETESTIFRSLLVFQKDENKYYRLDELDLNVPDLIFQFAGKDRKDGIESHRFIYDTEAETVEAYVNWLGSCIGILRVEEQKKDKSDENI